MQKLKQFKFIALLEGLSFLILMFIAMPIKYGLGIPEVVKYVGWAHGLLFIAYQIFMLQAGIETNQKFQFYFFGFLASILPFGTFVFDKKKIQPILIKYSKN